MTLVAVKNIALGTCVGLPYHQTNAFEKQVANGSGTALKTPGLLRSSKVINFTPRGKMRLSVNIYIVGFEEVN